MSVQSTDKKSIADLLTDELSQGILYPLLTHSTTEPIIGHLHATPDPLMELSAIPFLSHTPPTTALQPSADYILEGDQKSVEDMLCSLVTEGKLDFSFLSESGQWVANDPFTRSRGA